MIHSTSPLLPATKVTFPFENCVRVLTQPCNYGQSLAPTLPWFS